jgi:uncharacterized membrane protein YfhO
MLEEQQVESSQDNSWELFKQGVSELAKNVKSLVSGLFALLFLILAIIFVVVIFINSPAYALFAGFILMWIASLFGRNS